MVAPTRVKRPVLAESPAVVAPRMRGGVPAVRTRGGVIGAVRDGACVGRCVGACVGIGPAAVSAKTAAGSIVSSSAPGAASPSVIIGSVMPAGSPASSWSTSSSLAMPKSRSLGRRRPARASTITLPGFRSRWTMPCSCAVCTTSQIRSSSGTKRSSGIGPCRMSMRSSGVPRTSSIAIHRTPSDSAPKA